MEKDSFSELWAHELRDLRSTEQEMLDALPEPGSRKGDALREAFIEHRARAKEQVERLREIFLTGTRAERPTGHGVAAQRRRGRRGKRGKRDVADA